MVYFDLLTSIKKSHQLLLRHFIEVWSLLPYAMMPSKSCSEHKPLMLLVYIFFKIKESFQLEATPCIDMASKLYDSPPIRLVSMSNRKWWEMMIIKYMKWARGRCCKVSIEPSNKYKFYDALALFTRHKMDLMFPNTNQWTKTYFKMPPSI